MQMVESRPRSSRPQPRRSVNRVRTGCTTCKIRKIKCDETKPSCKRCTTTGRKCDGYSIPKQLLFEICTDPVEKWSYNYYRERTLKQIVSFQEYGFFDRVVMQVSHSQDIVRRMVVAIGAYHECVDAPTWLRSFELFAFACSQYHKAISRLRQRAASMSLEDILLCCILFTYFENIRGDVNGSLQHLRAANTIINEEQRRRLPLPTTATLLETTLAPILKLLNHASTTTTPVIQELEPDFSTPTIFTTLEEAQKALLQAVKSITAHLDYALETQHWEDTHQSTLDMLSKWESALQHYRDAPPPDDLPYSIYALGLHHLDLHYSYASNRLHVALKPDEMTYDEYFSEFDKMIEIALAMVSIFRDLQYTNQQLKEKLGFIPSYVSPLGYVAQRCRDPCIRREVIRILRSIHKVEGLWDSLVVSDVCEFMMGLEESMASIPVRSCSDVPKSARQQLMAANLFDFDPVDQKIKITQNISNPDLVKLRTLRVTPEHHPYCEIHWLDRRKPFTLLQDDARRKAIATTDPPGPVPKLDPRPSYSRIHPPATPPALLKASDPLTLFPDDIPGVFPQLQELPSNMWNAYYQTTDPILFLKRLGLNQIYTPNIDDGDCLRRQGVRFERMGIKTAQIRHVTGTGRARQT